MGNRLKVLGLIAFIGISVFASIGFVSSMKQERVEFVEQLTEDSVKSFAGSYLVYETCKMVDDSVESCKLSNVRLGIDTNPNFPRVTLMHMDQPPGQERIIWFGIDSFEVDSEGIIVMYFSEGDGWLMLNKDLNSSILSFGDSVIKLRLKKIQ